MKNRRFAILILVLLALACGRVPGEPPASPVIPPAQTAETASAADQFEVAGSPATITMEAEEATEVRLGILALDRLVNPRLGGHRLANELPTESVLLLQPDGTALFAYSDLFSRTYRGRKQQIVPGEDIEFLHQLPDLPYHQDLCSAIGRPTLEFTCAGFAPGAPIKGYFAAQPRSIKSQD